MSQNYTKASNLCKTALEEISNKPKEMVKMLPISWITVLFYKFQATWLHKFTAHMPVEILETAKETWARGLFGIPEEALKRAIDEATRTLEWPPSLAEFIKLCNRPQNASTMPFYETPSPHSSIALNAPLTEEQQAIHEASHQALKEYLDKKRKEKKEYGILNKRQDA